MAMRILLEHGASPFAKNVFSWTPIQYSSTKDAELYFKSLVAELEKKRVAMERAGREREHEVLRQRAAGVRLVTGEELETLKGLDPPPSVREKHGEWSPVEARRAMTPTAGKSESFYFNQSRARASSGD